MAPRAAKARAHRQAAAGAACRRRAAESGQCSRSRGTATSRGTGNDPSSGDCARTLRSEQRRASSSRDGAGAARCGWPQSTVCLGARITSREASRAAALKDTPAAPPCARSPRYPARGKLHVTPHRTAHAAQRRVVACRARWSAAVSWGHPPDATRCGVAVQARTWVEPHVTLPQSGGSVRVISSPTAPTSCQRAKNGARVSNRPRGPGWRESAGPDAGSYGSDSSTASPCCRARRESPAPCRRAAFALCRCLWRGGVRGLEDSQSREAPRTR